MRALNLKPLHIVIIVCLLLVCTASYGQKKYDAISFRVDSLAAMGLPQSALTEVDRLEKLARENNNTPQQIRAVVYRMTFESYLEQDALTAIISRLKIDIAQSVYPVKPVLQSVLAEMYWKYYQQNRYQSSQRSRLQKPDTDFTQWDLQTIISETSRLYRLSLADASREQNTSIHVLEGVLEGDSSTRYLRPTLYDLLLQRAFDFYLTDEPALTKPKMPFSLNDPAFFSDGRTFATLPVNITDTASTWYQGIVLLQQATAFHLRMDQQEALADIEMQRLKFLYDKSNVEHKDSLYLAALNKIVSGFAQKPISADALVLLGQYFFAKDSLVAAHQYDQRAVAAWPHSLGGENAANQLEIIEQKKISATIEDYYSPGKPLLAQLGYKNMRSAKVLVYRLSQAQFSSIWMARCPGVESQKRNLDSVW